MFKLKRINIKKKSKLEDSYYNFKKNNINHHKPLMNH